MNAHITTELFNKNNRVGINHNIPKNRSIKKGPKHYPISLELPPTKKTHLEDLVDNISDANSVVSNFSEATTCSILSNTSSVSTSTNNIYINSNNTKSDKSECMNIYKNIQPKNIPINSNNINQKKRPSDIQQLKLTLTLSHSTKKNVKLSKTVTLLRNQLNNALSKLKQYKNNENDTNNK